MPTRAQVWVTAPIADANRAKQKGYISSIDRSIIHLPCKGWPLVPVSLFRYENDMQHAGTPDELPPEEFKQLVVAWGAAAARNPNLFADKVRTVGLCEGCGLTVITRAVCTWALPCMHAFVSCSAMLLACR